MFYGEMVQKFSTALRIQVDLKPQLSEVKSISNRNYTDLDVCKRFKVSIALEFFHRNMSFELNVYVRRDITLDRYYLGLKIRISHVVEETSALINKLVGSDEVLDRILSKPWGRGSGAVLTFNLTICRFSMDLGFEIYKMIMWVEEFGDLIMIANIRSS